MKQPDLYVVHAAAVRDAAGVDARPGSVLIRGGRVLAAGQPDALPAELVARAQVIDRPGDLLLPAMVNAHTHLELTGIGPQPYDPAGGFLGWVLKLRQYFPPKAYQAHRREGDQPDDAWFVNGALKGFELAIHAGVQAVGDISRFISVANALRGATLAGQTYLEMFGLGQPFDQEGLDLIARENSAALQPHAPYSAGPALFEAASRSGRPVSCHLAETPDEQAFVEHLRGPFLEFLKSVDKWDDAFAAFYGRGMSPTQWMQPYLERAADAGGWLVAHCNYVSDEDIDLLADTNTSVAYCPLASEYFGHKDHRYRDMLGKGVNVCLGTDSIVGTEPNDPHPLGVLSAMRRLYQRDGTAPATLLAMATTHGAKALRLPAQCATLQPGSDARFACIAFNPDTDADPLVQALTGQNPIESISFEANAGNQND